MYQTLLGNSSLYVLLVRLDEDIARQCRKKGCPCGGVLHSARYPRKPRGVPKNNEASWSSRLSFCCAEDGRRKRTTPPSFRFLGRRVFAGIVVVLMSALQHGATPKRMAKLCEAIPVSRRTMERWRRWWREDFVRSRFWKAACGLLKKPVMNSRLPLSLLEAFGKPKAKDKLVDLLRFILPLTTSSAFHET